MKIGIIAASLLANNNVEKQISAQFMCMHKGNLPRESFLCVGR